MYFLCNVNLLSILMNVKNTESRKMQHWSSYFKALKTSVEVMTCKEIIIKSVYYYITV